MRFADVIGQEIIKERMVHGVRVGRVPHAQLILGAEGSGNLALALAYVQYFMQPTHRKGQLRGMQQL